MRAFFNAALLLSLVTSANVFAEVRLPKLLSDNLVLQRNTENKLWGWADKGESVSVFLNGKLQGNTVTEENDWSIQLASMPAGGPHTLEVKGRNSITLSNVMFGDVWVASGQSNMQTTMQRTAEMFPNAIAEANHPNLRQFTVPRTMGFKGPEKDFTNGQWQPTTPTTVGQHSAVAYYFGRKIMQKENVPIGILSSNFGGSPAECWLSEEALKKYPERLNKVSAFKDDAYLQALIAADKKASDAWHQQLNDNDLGLKANTPWFAANLDTASWPSLQLPNLFADQGLQPFVGTIWLRKTIELPANTANKAGTLRLGTLVDADTAYINGVEVGKTYYRYPPRIYSVKPNILREGQNTLTVRLQVNGYGAEWTVEKPYHLQVGDHTIDLTGDWQYQIGTTTEPAPEQQYVPYSQPLGCYNAMLAPLFNMKIKGVIWYQGESNTGNPTEYEEMFPELIQLWRKKWNQGDFPFLFVQLANYGAKQVEPSEGGWAETRFAQMKALELTNTAMTVTTDVGEWNDLHPLDKKSVGERLALSAQALAYGKKNVVYSGPLFNSVEAKKNTLILRFNHVGGGLRSKGGELKGFAIAGDDGQYVWAETKIARDKIIVWHKDISKPKYVRYAWANSPESANLYNKEGLPASAFAAEL